MGMIKFRMLNASEIECRISTVKPSGITLLLYKDARCDMNILDETVGPENWQRTHELINGNLFCNVGLNVNYKQEQAAPVWVWKQDVGTESYTEKEKGQASDSFKRACFNWGIGRELYTAPFIWIPSDKCNLEPTERKDSRGNPIFACEDRFYVSEIHCESKKIVSLSVRERKKNQVVFCMSDGSGEMVEDGEIREENEKKESQTIILAKRNVVEGICKRHRLSPEKICISNGEDWKNASEALLDRLIRSLKNKYGDS